ncbi:MAG: DUF3551 domain-containing protein [Bradyrhizobium sp.]|jgi:hypothetical protein
MPRAFVALPVVAVVFALAPMTATAREFPFCIKGCDFGGSRGDCSFVTYQQCQATASGRDAYCDANPYFNASADGPSGRIHQSRRKF